MALLLLLNPRMLPKTAAPRSTTATSTALIGSLDRLQAVHGEGAAAKKDKEKAQLKRALGLVGIERKCVQASPFTARKGADPPVLAG